MNIKDSVRDFVDQYGEPAVVSLDAQTHIFHFQRDGAWHEGDIAFVNRNGNFFRIIRQPDDSWLHAKTWRGFEPEYDWETNANLRRDDPGKLIALTGVGDQRKSAKMIEGLSLLPVGATSRSRRIVYRGAIARISFQRDKDTFQLHLGNDNSPLFEGKAWENLSAVSWMRSRWSMPATENKTNITYMKQPNRMIRGNAAAFELEESAAWGMFG